MVLARVVIHVLARVLPHVLARVLLHVLARVIIHVHDYYSKTCVLDCVGYYLFSDILPRITYDVPPVISSLTQFWKLPPKKTSGATVRTTGAPHILHPTGTNSHSLTV